MPIKSGLTCNMEDYISEIFFCDYCLLSIHWDYPKTSFHTTLIYTEFWIPFYWFLSFIPSPHPHFIKWAFSWLQCSSSCVQTENHLTCSEGNLFLFVDFEKVFHRAPDFTMWAQEQALQTWASLSTNALVCNRKFSSKLMQDKRA